MALIIYLSIALSVNINIVFKELTMDGNLF
jgi:hypothetical protein